MERARGFDPSCLGASQALQVEVSLFLSSISADVPPLQHRHPRGCLANSPLHLLLGRTGAGACPSRGASVTFNIQGHCWWQGMHQPSQVLSLKKQKH